MWRFLTLALLAAGCAGAPPQQPRVVEHVVVVSAPYPAPVIVEHRGHPGEHGTAHPKRPTTRLPSHAPRRHHGKVATPEKPDKRDDHAKPDKRDDHAKPDKVAKPDKRDKHAKHRKVARPAGSESYAKCEKRGESGKCEKPERHPSRCDDAPERCRTDVAKR